MVKLESDFKKIDEGPVHLRIKGVKPINEIEVLMAIHSLIGAIADINQITYDAAKLKVMNELIAVELSATGSKHVEEEIE